MPRKTKKIAVRDEFLILTNGKRTEKNYFEAVRSNYKSIFKISVKFMNDDPVALVDHAIGMKNARNEFPTDSVEPAIKTAKDNGIGIAFSNIAFEVWLIDHFEKCYTEKTAEKLIADFDRILRAKGYNKGYAKEDKQMITDVLMPCLDEAVHNADVVMQNRVLKYKEYRKDDNYPFCDWNSFTNVHKLIDALKLEKKLETDTQ